MATLISLLTDFGTRDPWVAICKGVILSIAPDVRLLDISHDVAPFEVAEGALVLAAALPDVPVGVHVAVVDPGVGTDRRAIAIRVGRGDVLVGPDNGLLLPATRALGGIEAVHVLEDPAYRRPVVSRTFHGRDVFSPAAAHLANGVPLERFGPPVAAGDLVALDLPRPTRGQDRLDTVVLGVDPFGSLVLAGDRADLEASLGGLQAGQRLLVSWPTGDGTAAEDTAAWAGTFGEVPPGGLLLHEDALGRLELAVNRGSAAVVTGAGPRTAIQVRRLA